MSIVLENVSKRFGEKTIFSDFNACLETGKTTAVMGASGTGKTTLAYLLLGLESPDGGRICGVPQKRSAVFQEDRLSENYSVLANAASARRGKAAKKEAAACLEQLGLGTELKTPVHTLSGGMKRRTALARALVASYDFLVLDEPFKGIDAHTKETVMRYVEQAVLGKTVLLITHDPAEAERLAAQILRLDGKTG